MQRKSSIQVNLLSPWTVKNGKATAPVVMMVEGVHNGNHGPIYWASHILKENAHKWHNIPVCIDHPVDSDGKAVSIKEQPEKIIGRVVNGYFDEKIKGIKATLEIPLNPEKYPLTKLQQIKEVSTGLFSDEIYESGQWNNERFMACAISMLPDHLALLPDGIGACSWEDGAGIRDYMSVFLQEAAMAVYQQMFEEEPKIEPLIFQQMLETKPEDSKIQPLIYREF